MADKKETTAKPPIAKSPIVKTPVANSPLFTKDNYRWMIIGAAIVALGMFLMSGGKNANPNTFDTNLVYGSTRITVAPILIVLGLLVEVYAIFKKPKLKQQ